MAVIERSTIRKINKESVRCHEVRDGTQRHEWVGYVEGEDALYGAIFTSRGVSRVTAKRPNREEFSWVVSDGRMTKDQAFSAARTWLVSRSQEEAAA
jgi:hypothetical protein